MGAGLVYAVLTIGCVAALVRPIYGCAAFYFLNLLDPAWNWRWSLPHDLGAQKWLFAATAIGALLHPLAVGSAPQAVNRAVLCLLGFLAANFISLQVTDFPERGGFYTDILWRVIAMTILACYSCRRTPDLHLLAWGAVLGQGYNAYAMNLEYLSLGYCRYVHMTKWGANGLDNNTYSILTLPVFSIAISMALSSKKVIPAIVAAAIALLQAHQLMIMESRGGMLGAILVAAIVTWFCPKTRRAITMIAAGLIAASVLAGPSVVKEFTSSFQSGDSLDESASSRFDLWSAGFSMLADYPLIGVGPDASRYYVPQYYPGGIAVTNKALHNLFFEVMTGVGFFGGLLFFGFYFFPYAAVWRRRKELLAHGGIHTTCAIAVLAGIPGYMLASMFSSGSLIESCYLLIVIACGLLAINAESDASQDQIGATFGE